MELIHNTFSFSSKVLRKTAIVVICHMTVLLMKMEENANTRCTVVTQFSAECTHFQWNPFLGETASMRKQCNFFRKG